MNTLLYARVSTDRQAQKDLSIPAQLSTMKEFVKKNGWKVAGTYVDAGESARTVNRPELNKLIIHCKENKNKIDIVLVHKIDRLARNLVGHATIKAILKSKGIRLVSVVENCDDTAAGMFMENIMASLAEYHSVNLGDEVKKGNASKLKKGGWPAKAPLGYKSETDEQNKIYLVENPNTAPLVRQIFEMYSTGNYSLDSVAEEMYDRGLKTKFDKKLNKEKIKQILTRRFYIGKMIWHGKEYQGNHSPLISQKLFYQVQEIVKRRGGDCGEKGKYRFLLRGVAYCQNCGEKLTAEIHSRGSYYRCVQRTGNNKCTERYSPVNYLDTQLEILYQRLQPPVKILKLIKEELIGISKKRQKIAQREITKLEQALAKLEQKELKLADELIEQSLSRNVYSKLQEKITKDKAVSEGRLAQFQVDYTEPIDFLDKCIAISSSLYYLHQKFNFDQRKTLLKAVVKKIEVKNREIVNIELNPPFSILMKDDLPKLFDCSPVKGTKKM